MNKNQKNETQKLLTVGKEEINDGRSTKNKFVSGETNFFRKARSEVISVINK